MEGLLDFTAQISIAISEVDYGQLGCIVAIEGQILAEVIPVEISLNESMKLKLDLEGGWNEDGEANWYEI